MIYDAPVVLLALGLLAARWVAQVALERSNARHVRAHAKEVPEAFRGTMDAATYARSVEYTLAKGRFGQVEDSYRLVILVAVLLSGVLPWAHDAFVLRFGSSPWAGAAFLLCVFIVLGAAGLPFDWHAQFKLEARFGFNTTTAKVWWLDRLKALALAVALGWPLLALILVIVDWAGRWWWLWAWGATLAFQVALTVVAPVLILPLFNRFTPLAEGSLRDRLLELARRTGFRARSIQVMDGSRRSRHSNAFFAGLGRFRKIVLFDTLVQQLTEDQLEAVLAHEIGHYKKRHIPKMFAWSALSLLAAFAALAWLARQDWFLKAFGFHPGSVAPALLLFGLLAGAVTFWSAPVASFWLRRNEYQADRFAAEATGGIGSLIGALRRLTEKNLGNLTPHPVYSAFYYSHPTLLEREAALRRLSLPGQQV